MATSPVPTRPRRTVARTIGGLASLNVLLLVVGGDRGGAAACERGPCVGLVFDVGGLGDKSFNDSAHRGLVRARDEQSPWEIGSFMELKTVWHPIGR